MERSTSATAEQAEEEDQLIVRSEEEEEEEPRCLITASSSPDEHHRRRRRAKSPSAVSEAGDDGERLPRRLILTANWREINEAMEKRIKNCRYWLRLACSSAAAAAAVVVLLSLCVAGGFASSRQGVDFYVFGGLTPLHITTFKPTNTRPQNYTHVPSHPLTCNTTTTTSQMTLTCPANYPPQNSEPPTKPTPTCPAYFRWIHNDLNPWRSYGITRQTVEEIEKHYPGFRHFRLTIVNGTAYVKQYDKAFQTRDVFTLWGVLQLLKMYPGQVPDLDLMFQCHDRPSVRKSRYRALPLFHYCGSDDTYDIVFPDWSFWGWPEINVKPWGALKKDLEQGNMKVNWTDREPYAYWRGSLYTGDRRKLVSCNSTTESNALIYKQDWAKEIREGFKNSDMSAQCTHRYKLYMEGNAWSVSEKYILACDSMSLLVNPIFYDFFTRSLIPLKHYWPIDNRDLCRSIKFAVDWGNHHPEQAQEIGKTGSRFVQKEITMQNVYDYMFHVLSEYGKLMAYRPTVPPGAVELCSEEWMCPSDDRERIYKIQTMVKDDPTAKKNKQPCRLPPPFEENELRNFTKVKADNIRKVETWTRKGKSD